MQVRQYDGGMNLGFSEMVFIFLIALIIFGPKKLPEIGRQIGKALNEFKRASNEFKAQIESEIMQRPIMEALRRNGLSEKLVYLNPTEPFNLYLKVGLLAGLFVASPFVLYQVWLFISPGLYRNEKRYLTPFMFSTVGLFLAGGYFGYKLVYPQALEFLIGYGKQFTPMITIGEYTDLFLTIIIGMGVIFELPILVFFLSLMGIVTAQWMWRNLRYSILVII